VVTLRAAEGARGELLVEFDGAATHDVARRMNQIDGDPDEAVALNTLRELCAQAAGSLALEAPLAGVKLAVTSVAKATETVNPSAVLAEIAVANLTTLPLRLWGELTLVDTPKKPARPAAPPPSTATPGLDVILDIDLPLMVRFGRTEMPLRTIAALSPGSVIDFGRSPDEPVEVLVSNQIVARGEVVIVGGNYGVRITDVTSAADRVRSVEGQFA
jgi:flagellar motor switch protein FliN/FliY